MANTSKKEIDIEIADILWELLRRWRVILIFAVVGAVLRGGKRYISDYKTANTPKETVVEQTIEKANVELNKTEMETVIAAIALNSQIDATSAYLNESELMAINPYQENAAFMQYVVVGENSENVVAAYKDYVRSGNLGELVSIVEADNAQKSDTFIVKVAALDAANCTTYAESAKSALNILCEQLLGQGQAHELILVQENQNVIVDLELAELQETKALALKENMSTLASMKSNMSSDQ